jgi:hypothetical protein
MRVQRQRATRAFYQLQPAPGAPRSAAMAPFGFRDLAPVFALDLTPPFSPRHHNAPRPNVFCARAQRTMSSGNRNNKVTSLRGQ